MDPITPVSQAPIPPASSPQAPVTAPFDGPIALCKFAWNTFTKRWKLFLGIILVPIALYVIAVLLIGSTVYIGTAGSILGFIVIIAAYVFFLAAMPATAQAMHRVTVDPGTPVSIKSQYRFGFSVFWSMLLLVIMIGFIIQGANLLLVIPGIFVAVSTILYMYTFVIDGKRNFAALTESYSLVRGRWWGVFGRFLFLALMALICAVIYLVVIGIVYLLQMLPDVIAVIIGSILGLVLFTFGWTFGNAYMYRLYATLKATRGAPAPTSTFKGWLIAFLCIGAVLVPIAVMGVLSSVVLVSLNTARMKGLEAQQNSTMRMAEIQRQIDAENLQMMQQNQSDFPTQN
jgi:hypothetical protein